MPKATRVRYSGSAPYVDDTQVNRATALGSSSRLTTEDIKELGNIGIVEVVDDVPVVDVSLDVNENGTNEVVGLLTNKGYGCQVVAVPTATAIGSAKVQVRPGSYYGRGNRILFDGAVLPVSGTAVQHVYLQPEVTNASKVAIGATLPAGAVSLATFTPTGGIVRQADITDTRSFKTIKEADFELAKVDMFAPIKQSGSGDAIMRTMYMERVYANNMDLSFQTDGVATASYRLETDNKRWFLNNNAQIVVNEFKLTATTAVVLEYTPAQLANGKYMLKVVKNGIELEEGIDFTVTPASKTLTLATAPIAGDMLKVRYTSVNGGKFFSPVPAIEEPHPEMAGGLKAGQVEMYLVDKNGVADAKRTSRVQSTRISLPLERDALNELGSIFAYDRPLQLPVSTTVSVELRDSDLELLARFAGFDNLNTVTEIALTDFVKDKGLLIKLFRETDAKRAKLPAGHPDKYAIKTIYIKNLVPQSEAWDVRVDSDATQSFDFLAHNIAISDSITP